MPIRTPGAKSHRGTHAYMPHTVYAVADSACKAPLRTMRRAAPYRPGSPRACGPPPPDPQLRCVDVGGAVAGLLDPHPRRVVGQAAAVFARLEASRSEPNVFCQPAGAMLRLLPVSRSSGRSGGCARARTRPPPWPRYTSGAMACCSSTDGETPAAADLGLPGGMPPAPRGRGRLQCGGRSSAPRQGVRGAGPPGTMVRPMVALRLPAPIVTGVDQGRVASRLVTAASPRAASATGRRAGAGSRRSAAGQPVR